MQATHFIEKSILLHQKQDFRSVAYGPVEEAGILEDKAA